jgi:hypothetical protein
MIKRKKDTRTRQTMLGKTLRIITHQHEPNIIRKISWKMINVGDINIITCLSGLFHKILSIIMGRTPAIHSKTKCIDDALV